MKVIVQTLRSLMLRVQAAAGFRSGRLMQDIERPNELCYIEEWDGSKELDQQIRSTHYTRLLALMETAAEPPEMRLCWVTDVRGLEYLAMVRLADGSTNFTCPNDAE
jgi:quinol monooxygenase YgiN